MIPEPAIPTGAYITEEADSDVDVDDDECTTELYDMYEVSNEGGPKLPKTPASPAKPPSLPPYQLCGSSWGGSSKTRSHRRTPLPLAPIRRGLVERLKPRHVEMASFERDRRPGLDQHVPHRPLRLKSANCTTSCTVGCADDPDIGVGDGPFIIHAPIVQTAPFYQLGYPFHHLLLCRLEDHPNHIDVYIHDPVDLSRSSPELPELPLERHVTSLHPRPSTNHLSTSVNYSLYLQESCREGLPGRATSLPKDFRIGVQRRPEAPIHPPAFIPGIRLMQKRSDGLDPDKYGFL
ncbi:hypothetical protein EDB92DRAFT_2115657 [Lactarius akahatsu]|uniref:Uncharacterized protein n=1 Tax=Lactarius akahatsu TaxID=416441 RepID=A0AAD4LEF6_9AGAM|nr:hypothetical protein EDB92DRAFT_2115657 [Lactarius akahatsu]